MDLRSRLHAALGTLGACVAVACTTIPVPGPALGTQRPAAAPRVSDLDAFLRRHVDTEGRLDYHRAARDREDLDRFVRAVAHVSPDNTPAAFATEGERLSYWINAYNAWVVAMVLRAYPIESVLEVPNAIGWIEPRAGFFFFSRVVLGEDRMSLYALENGIVRDRFDEPRIHFALNCASKGCPRLPAEAFRADRLDEQLTRETRRFLREERNLSVDPARRVVRLSAIFDWYEADFTGWMERHRPDAPATLLGWLADQAPPEIAARVADCERCSVEFASYDWSLNDRKSSE